MMKMKRDQRGFTLMETAIAMILMMVVGLGGASLFAYAIKYNSGADDRSLALALGQQRMEQFRSLPFNHASLTATATTGTVENTTHGGRPFRVTTTIVNNAAATMKTITINIVPMSGTSGNYAAWSRSAVRLVTQRTSMTTGLYL